MAQSTRISGPVVEDIWFISRLQSDSLHSNKGFCMIADDVLSQLDVDCDDSLMLLWTCGWRYLVHLAYNQTSHGHLSLHSNKGFCMIADDVLSQLDVDFDDSLMLLHALDLWWRYLVHLSPTIRLVMDTSHSIPTKVSAWLLMTFSLS